MKYIRKIETDFISSTQRLSLKRIKEKEKDILLWNFNTKKEQITKQKNKVK